LKLSRFEKDCLDWYYENISPFSIEVGIASDVIREMKMDKVERRIFLKAMNLIRLNQIEIENEMAEAKVKKTRKK